jgi:ribokinase
MGGRVGADDFGQRLRASLDAAGVDHRYVGTDPEAGSGMSVAILEEGGEYGAVIVSGANLRIDPDNLAAWKDLWAAPLLLLQNEVPDPVNLAAARAARAAGARVLLNAAPARSLSPVLLDLVDVLVVNRIEAAALAGVPVGGSEEALRALDGFHRPGQAVVITLARDGLVARLPEGSTIRVGALPVRVASTHGAGDAFCGALAARLAAGDDFVAGCRYASAAAALVVSTPEAERDRMAATSVPDLARGIDAHDVAHA